MSSAMQGDDNRLQNISTGMNRVPTDDRPITLPQYQPIQPQHPTMLPLPRVSSEVEHRASSASVSTSTPSPTLSLSHLWQHLPVDLAASHSGNSLPPLPHLPTFHTRDRRHPTHPACAAGSCCCFPPHLFVVGRTGIWKCDCFFDSGIGIGSSGCSGGSV
jgi:hypothetical protein